MYRPPAVTWDVRPVRWHSAVLSALILCAALLQIAFLVLQGWSASSFALLLVLLGSTLMAGRSLQKTVDGQLNWDGTQWHWLGAEEQALSALTCVLDLQTRMLVNIHGEQGSCHWLWLEAGGMGARWQALRRAVVASKSVQDRDEVTAMPKH